MAKITLAPGIENIKGKHGDTIFYTKNGQQYSKPYKKPFDPKTEKQIKNRTKFTEAIKKWKEMTQEDKKIYQTRSKTLRITGYNLFISEYMNKKKDEP